MNQTYRILPVYTSDVSGVCSALYELGGMVVMHDPSGCNSTYNTHDEIRWYKKDSLIYISGLTEHDAVMGNDWKFLDDVLETARELKPEFIAITNSPIPYLTGTDFPALVKKLERESGITSFYVTANGMHDYTAGAGAAFKAVAIHLTDGRFRSVVPHSVNILGATPLDYAAEGSCAGIRDIIEGEGFRVNSIWAMDSSPDAIRRAGEASVNLVISSTGLSAAKVLKERFKTPYIIGTPVGKFTGKLIAALKEAERTGRCGAAYAGLSECTSPEVTLIGEPVVMGSLAAAIQESRGTSARVLCATEVTEGLLCGGFKRVFGEEDAQRELADSACVVADPLYKLICPEGVRFYPLPSLALSGRIYLKDMCKLCALEV